MPPTRHPFREAAARQILAYLRQGAYPHVAAEAAGVPAEAYDEWIRKGNGPKVRAPYRHFASEVRKAQAQARLLAETEVWKADPKVWLGRGPGKETATRPGWTRETSPQNRDENRGINLLASPVWKGIWAAILKGLADFPEAKLAISRSLAEQAPGSTNELPAVPPAEPIP
jgi:hypothetical protein